jgi:hypothetical protein
MPHDSATFACLLAAIIVVAPQLLWPATPNHPLTPPPPCVYASGVNLRQALRAARWMLGDLFIRSTPTPTVDAAEQLANREAEIDVWEEKEL